MNPTSCWDGVLVLLVLRHSSSGIDSFTAAHTRVLGGDAPGRHGQGGDGVPAARSGAMPACPKDGSSTKKNRTPSRVFASGKRLGGGIARFRASSPQFSAPGAAPEHGLGQAHGKPASRGPDRGGSRCRPSTLTRGPIADPAAPAGVHVGGGLHAQQSRATSRTRGAETPA